MSNKEIIKEKISALTDGQIHYFNSLKNDNGVKIAISRKEEISDDEINEVADLIVLFDSMDKEEALLMNLEYDEPDYPDGPIIIVPC